VEVTLRLPKKRGSEKQKKRKELTQETPESIKTKKKRSELNRLRSNDRTRY
jgi:hypothetical protein